MATHEQWIAWIEELRHGGLADWFHSSMENDPAAWADTNRWRLKRELFTDLEFAVRAGAVFRYALEAGGAMFTLQWARRAAFVVVEAAYPKKLSAAEGHPIVWHNVNLSDKLPAACNPLIELAKSAITVLEAVPTNPNVWLTTLGMCRQGFHELATKHRPFHAMLIERYTPEQHARLADPQPSIVQGLQMCRTGGTAMYGTKRRMRTHGKPWMSLDGEGRPTVPIVNSAGEPLEIEFGVGRYLTIYGDFPECQLFDRLSIQAGRALASAPPSVWQGRIAPETIAIEPANGVDADRWIMALFDLGWNIQSIGAHESSRLAWGWSDRSNLVSVPFDRIAMLRDPRFPMAENLKVIPDPPDCWYAVRTDLASASVVAIDLLIALGADRPVEPSIVIQQAAHAPNLNGEAAVADDPGLKRLVWVLDKMIRLCETVPCNALLGEIDKWEVEVSEAIETTGLADEYGLPPECRPAFQRKQDDFDSHGFPQMVHFRFVDPYGDYHGCNFDFFASTSLPRIDERGDETWVQINTANPKWGIPDAKFAGELKKCLQNWREAALAPRKPNHTTPKAANLPPAALEPKAVPKTITAAVAAQRYEVTKKTIRVALKAGDLTDHRTPNHADNATLLVDENEIASKWRRRSA